MAFIATSACILELIDSPPKPICHGSKILVRLYNRLTIVPIFFLIQCGTTRGAEVDCKETATMRPGRPFRLTTVTLAVGVKVIEERTTLQILAHNDDDDDSSVPTPTTVAHLKVGVVRFFVHNHATYHSADFSTDREPQNGSPSGSLSRLHIHRARTKVR